MAGRGSQRSRRLSSARRVKGLHDGAAPLLSCIVESVSDRDRELRDELERLVAQTTVAFRLSYL